MSAQPSAAAAEINATVPANVTDNSLFFEMTLHTATPSLAFADVAAVAFAVATVVLAYRTYKHGGRFLRIGIYMGVAETIGYGCRASIIQNPNAGAYLIMTLLLLLAPVLLALVNYRVLAILLKQVDRAVYLCCCPLSARFFARVFFYSDLLTLVIQTGGGTLVFIQKIAPELLDGWPAYGPAAIVVFGLAVQIGFFGYFCLITWRVFHREEYLLGQSASLRPLYLALVGSSVLLMVRNVFRVSQFSLDEDVPEWSFALFETVPIFGVFVVFCGLHYGRILEVAGTHKPAWVEEVEAARSLVGRGAV